MSESEIEYKTITNDRHDPTMKLLIDVKNIFSRQLPKMPKEYITKLVFDRNHNTLVIYQKPSQKEGDKGQVLGGVCYRKFTTQKFCEIVFLAITSNQQVKGYGTKLMNRLKDTMQKEEMEYMMTYADNFAIGYFKKLGFSKDYQMNQDRWKGYIKDYEGGTLMECYIHPKIDYLKIQQIIAMQKEVMIKKIKSLCINDIKWDPINYKKLIEREGEEPSIDPMTIPGVSVSGWQIEDYKELEQSQEKSFKLQCQNIIESCKKHKSVWPFLEPVNSHDVPDYYDIIKKPMGKLLYIQILKQLRRNQMIMNIAIRKALQKIYNRYFRILNFIINQTQFITSVQLTWKISLQQNFQIQKKIFLTQIRNSKAKKDDQQYLNNETAFIIFKYFKMSNQYDFSHARVPPTSYGGPSAGMTTANRAANTQSRQITTVKGINKNQKASTKTDFHKPVASTPEEKAKKEEQDIHRLVEASAINNAKGNFAEALSKAKEAFKKEGLLRRQRDQDANNQELTYCVQFNLANQLQNNDIKQDAITKYQDIIKSKQHPQAGKLRVNMGNIYFSQEKYVIAMKMYRMALDLIPVSSKYMRFKILRNIGHTFVKLGQYKEAINSYESIMKGSPDFQTAFNLLLCFYALGDKKSMKDCFISMINIEIPGFINQEEQEEQDEDELNTYTDILMQDLKQKKAEAIKIIVDSGKLIAPVIEQDIIQGFDWILETLKVSLYNEVENEIEICKAMQFLKRKEMEKAIETLKSFQKKDTVIMGRVATNISFLHFLENNFPDAEKHADIAISYDRYNAKALVNRGNCLYVKNEFLRAKEQYLEAIGVEADCIEALYNLAFVNKKMNMFMEALQALEKLQTIVSLPEVLYQMANIHEFMGNTKQAMKWYQVLLTKVPSDPNILARVGNIFAREDDDTQALHYYQESYRYLPTNIETISWLGIFYVKQEAYEKSCHYFERASQIQSKEIKWRLMVASCYRRMGSYQKALKIYEEIYQEAPDNMECLRFLVQICKDMSLPYEEYASKLIRLEAIQQPSYNNQQMEQQQQQQPPSEDEEESQYLPNPIQQQGRPNQVPPKKEANLFSDDEPMMD